jgi:integrase/recombinase XerD
MGILWEGLRHLEESRKCAVATRKQRLAAIHSLARFVGLHSPEHIEWCGQLRTIPPKRAPRSAITYLEKSEMDDLSAPRPGQRIRNFNWCQIANTLDDTKT